MKKSLILIVLFISVCGVTALNAQVLHAVIGAAGGIATGTGGTAGFTVGQLVYTTNTGTNGSVAQGVQQPYEINVVSGINDIYGIDLLSVYPNPTSNFMILKITINEISSPSYQICNINGSIIRTVKVSGPETTIDLATLKPAVYFLQVFAGNEIIKTFKITKK